MSFASFIQAFVGKRNGQQQVDLPRSLGVPDLEKDFDRTSDSFIDAAHFLERCLPRTFGI